MLLPALQCCALHWGQPGDPNWSQHISSPEPGQSPWCRGLGAFTRADLPAVLESCGRLMISLGASTNSMRGLALKGQGRGKEYHHNIFHYASLDLGG